MAEQVSRQAAKLATTPRGKMAPHEAYGKKRVIVITSPAAVTWAAADTIASPVVLPVGTRFTVGSYVSCEDMGTSIVCDIGIRNVAGTAIDADGIAAAIDVATAAVRTLAANGVLVKDGVEYVTTVPSVVYATLSGGTPTANAQIRIEVECVTPD